MSVFTECEHCGIQIARPCTKCASCKETAYHVDAARKDERASIVAWLRAEVARAWQLDGPGMMSPEWICEAIESGAHMGVKT